LSEKAKMVHKKCVQKAICQLHDSFNNAYIAI